MSPNPVEGGDAGDRSGGEDSGSAGWRHRLWSWRRGKRRWLDWVRLGLSLDCDVYHAHDCNALSAATVCAVLTGRTLVYDSHELWLEWNEMRGASRGQVRRWWPVERVGTSLAARCVTVSEGLADVLGRRYHRRDVLVVKNCPRRRDVTALQPREQARRELGWAPQEKIVLHQGGLLACRGLAELVQAAGTLPDVRFVLVGPDSAYARELRAAAPRLSAGNVEFTGHREEAVRDQMMRAADLGAVLTQDRSTSYRFSLPNKMFEYMSNGLPTLASDLPTHRQIVAETGACVLVDADDPAAIADGIRRFFALGEDQRRRMGEQALAAHLSKYNMEAQMAPLLAFYESCADRFGRAEPRRGHG